MFKLGIVTHNYKWCMIKQIYNDFKKYFKNMIKRESI